MGEIEVDTGEAEPLFGVVHAQRRQQADGSVKHVMSGSHPVIEVSMEIELLPPQPPATGIVLPTDGGSGLRALATVQAQPDTALHPAVVADGTRLFNFLGLTIRAIQRRRAASAVVALAGEGGSAGRAAQAGP